MSSIEPHDELLQRVSRLPISDWEKAFLIEVHEQFAVEAAILPQNNDCKPPSQDSDS